MTDRLQVKLPLICVRLVCTKRKRRKKKKVFFFHGLAKTLEARAATNFTLVNERTNEIICMRKLIIAKFPLSIGVAKILLN